MFRFKIKILSWKLRRWERSKDVDKILPLIHSEYISIRLKAIRALGRIKDEKVLGDLLLLLKDQNEFIRKEVEISLVEISPDEQIIEIIKKSRAHWDEYKKKKKEENEVRETIDKDLYSFKGRISGNISQLQHKRNKVNKPIHWG